MKFLLLLPFTLWAVSTSYIWINDDPPFGHCYEIDNQTKGQQYSVKVAYKKCKPESTTFKWFGDPLKGHCAEVDAQTEGSKYSKKVGHKKCIGKEKEYKLIEGKCYVVTDSLAHTTDKKNCSPDQTLLVWKPKQNIWSGGCYQIDSETMGQVFSLKVKNQLCRPTNTQLTWYNKTCYEIDAENGPQAYSVKISDKKCKKNSSFKWVETAPLAGNCLEVSTDLEGKEIFQVVSNNSCKPEKTELIWQSSERFAGKCLEIDSETQGKKFAAPVATKDCRPKDYTFIGDSKCFEVDSKTLGYSYARLVNSKNCKEDDGKIYWVPKKNGWGGHCYKGTKQTDRSLCRPKKVALKWHAEKDFDGACYEYDPKEGNLSYSYRIVPEKCKPKKEKLEYLFVKSENEIAGKCYQVDKTNPKRGYSEVVKNKYCKKALINRGKKLPY